ncbi:ABC transporter permease [Actinomadura kijaniata]|uniref:ABC transporter permease n=1 Tax=Actinomadura kijaniata TaxID=46161 RepID=UPI002FE738EC
MTAVGAPGGPARWHGAGLGTQLWVLTARVLRAYLLDPRLLVANMLGPLLMLTMFSQMLGSLARAPGFPAGVRYVDFLVPALLITSAMQQAFGSAVGLTLEMRDGIVTRLRAMPLWPGSVLLARSLADLVRGGLQLLLILVLAALVFGFRPPGGPVGALAAGALALAVGCCLGWIFVALACWIRNAELVQSVAGLLTFPMIFASTAFVPAGGLPGWLRAVVRVNPATYGIEAARDLVLGVATPGGVAIALAVSAAVGTTAAAVAVRGFQRRP